MASSGIVKSWVHSTYGAYYSWEWTSKVKSAGVTTVTWKLYGKGRTTGPNWLKNECNIEVTVNSKTTTIYTLKWSDCPDPQTASSGTNISFNESQPESFRTEGSFTVTHDSDGAASFDVNIFASFFDGTGTGESTSKTVALNTNKPKYTLTLTKSTGISAVSGGGSYTKGTSVTATATVSDGYLFTDWQNSAGTSKSTEEAYTFYMPGSNLSLTATARRIYTITYSNVPSSYNGKKEYTVISSDFTLTEPKKTGYTFIGWTGSNGTTKQTTVTVRKGTTGNLSYTANWTANSYKVAYNGNNSTSGSMTASDHVYDTSKKLTKNTYEREYTVTYNHNYTGSTNATKTGKYTFDGWNTNSSGTGTSYDNEESVINLTTSGTKTLYAQWDDSTAKISYTPTRKGYTFGGWYTTVALTTSVTHPYTPTSNKTFYAKWTANTYAVKYNANGGSGTMSNSSHVYDTSKSLTANAFTLTGYNFKGWNTKADGSGTSYSNGASVKNLTSTNGGTFNLYAQWEAKNITVTFDANGGSTPDPATKTVTYDDTYGTLPSTTLRGYTFSGWYTTKTGGTQITSSTKVSATSAQKLYAHWAANTLTITCNKNSGTGGVDKFYVLFENKFYTDTTKKVAVTEIAVPTRTGYTFGGYNYTSSSGITEKVVDADGTIIAENTYWSVDPTIKAVWNENVVNIYYYANGGSTSGNGYTVDSVDDCICKNGSRQFHTLSYTSDDPNGLYNADTSFRLTRTGYTFAGWMVRSTEEVLNDRTQYATTKYAQHDDLTKNVSNTSVVNCYLDAQWTPNTDTAYTVHHWKQNLSATSNTQNSTNYTLADTDTKTGTTATRTSATAKTYSGFTAPQSIIQKTIADDGTTVVDVYYTRNSYTVSLTKGTGVASVTGGGSYKYEESVTVEAVTSTGYTWKRWDGTHASTDNKFTFTMPSTNVSLTAISHANKYTLTYVGQGGKQSSGGGAPDPGSSSDIVVTVTYNQSFTVRPESWAFTRTGYWFLGWATKANSKDVSKTWVAGDDVTWTRTSDLKLYAVWKSKGVLYVDDGSKFVPYTIWIDSGSKTGGPDNNGWYQYTAWIDTGDESQGTHGWIQLGSMPD